MKLVFSKLLEVCRCVLCLFLSVWASHGAAWTAAARSWKQSIKPTLLSAETVEEAASFFQQYNTDPYMVAEILNRLGYPSLIPEELVPRQRDGYCPVSPSSENMWGDEVEKRRGGGVLFQNSMGQKACFVSWLLWALFWKDSYQHKGTVATESLFSAHWCCAWE